VSPLHTTSASLATVQEIDSAIADFKSKQPTIADIRNKIVDSKGKIDFSKLPALWEDVNRPVNLELETSELSDEVQREYTRLRKVFDDVDRQISALPGGKKLETIDWAYWEKELPDKSLLTAYKSALNSLTLPEFKDDITAENDQAFDQLFKNGRDIAASLTKRRSELGLDGPKAVDPGYLLSLGTTIDEVAKTLNLSAKDPMLQSAWQKAQVSKPAASDDELAKKGDYAAYNRMNNQIGKTFDVAPKSSDEPTVDDFLEHFPEWDKQIQEDLEKDQWDENSVADLPADAHKKDKHH
jgi:hypothetical protein